MKKIIICDDSKPDEVIKICENNNFGLEIQSFHDPRINITDNIENHKKILKNISLISMHGMFGDLCPGSFDSLVADVAMTRFNQSYQIALQLKVSHLVFHHGYVPHTSSPNGWLNRCNEFWKKFLENKNNNIKIHIENMLDWDPNLLFDLIDKINKPFVDVNLDIGHAHCDSKISIIKWIEKLKNKIGYVHMHDNHGKDDEHLGLGNGTIPIEEVCNALNEYSLNSIWAIEAEGNGIIQSLEWLEKKGFIDNLIL